MKYILAFLLSLAPVAALAETSTFYVVAVTQNGTTYHVPGLTDLDALECERLVKVLAAKAAEIGGLDGVLSCEEVAVERERS